MAYRISPGKPPGVVFLCGLLSDMSGTKAQMLESFCRGRGQAYLRFDYTGHGLSSGEFTDGTIGAWADDAIAVLDELVQGPQILVGSSMGGWLMLLAALARPERIAGLVGVAAAPDFTEDVIWARLGDEEREKLVREGVIQQRSEYGAEPYAVTMRLIEEGRRHLLLGNPIPLSCPVRLLHGMADEAAPWRTSMRLAERLASENIVVSLIKDGDHRLSRPEDLTRICATVAELCDQAPG
ncbi:MAG: alpha/beta hydrolase [Alphaproteobacteria bacterium]